MTESLVLTFVTIHHALTIDKFIYCLVVELKIIKQVFLLTETVSHNNHERNFSEKLCYYVDDTAFKANNFINIAS